MAGAQVGFKLKSSADHGLVRGIYNQIESRLVAFCDKYETNDILYVQILYVTITGIKALELQNINKVPLNKNLVNIKDTKYKFSSRFLPLTTNTKYFGEFILGDTRLTYLELINSQKKLLLKNDITLDDFSSMYIYNDSYIILSKFLNENNTEISREIYDINLGVFEGSFVDFLVDGNPNHFTRSDGNTTVFINNSLIYKVTQAKELKAIKDYVSPRKKESLVSNPFIGSLDLETYVGSDGYSKVYALGFCGLNEDPITFYLDNKDYSSDDLLLSCFNLMLSNKYNGYIFYAHNLSSFDSKFILKILNEANIRLGYNHYILDPLYRDDNLLRLTIKVKRDLSDTKQALTGVRKDPGFNKIVLIDSMHLLNGSLANLCRSFGLEVVKGHFPHEFVKRDTLNYVGNTPAMEY
jgi:hypothetical protein